MEINTKKIIDEIKDKSLKENVDRDSLELEDEENKPANESKCCCSDGCDCECNYESRLLNHSEICDIIDEYLDDFDYTIKNRGKDYYEKENIVSVIRNNNRFIARVDGTERYKIEIIFDDEEDYVDYSCSCPCEFPCKHEYAVLLAIKNNEYSNIKLKPNIPKKELAFQEMVEKISAEELKSYILSKEGKDYICFEMEHFENHFLKYLPRQDYEYYYNNLYNSIVLDGYQEIKYINLARALINSGEYQEAFYAIKAIIEAANDTKLINKWNDLIDQFPSLGMLLRIIYRKSNKNDKSNIDEWLEILKENNYYESLYLEDIVLTIK